MGDTRLDDRRFGPQTRNREPACPEHIYKPRWGLNDVSVLSNSCYGRSLNRDKDVIWRMSDEGL